MVSTKQKSTPILKFTTYASLIICFSHWYLQVQDYLEYMGPDARVVIIPSIRDANHDFVFPQVIFLPNKINCTSLLDLVIF